MVTFSKQKAGAALAAFALVLLVTSGPAAASVEVGIIYSGTFNIDAPDPYGVFPEYNLADPAERPCIPGPPFPDPPTIDIDIANYPTGGATEVTDIYIGSYFDNLGFFGGTHWYEHKMTLAPDPPYDNSGTITGSAMTQNLTLEMDIYDYGHHVELEPEEECPTSTLACHAIMDLDLSGTWIPSLRSAVLSGNGTIDTLTGFCPDTAMVEFLDGATVDVDNLFIDFV